MEREKIKNLVKNVFCIERGASSASFSAPFLFVKYIIRYQDKNVYEREKYLGSILKKFDWYPTLLYHDDINQFFIYENVGVPVTSKNKPDDLTDQFNQILKDMKSVNIQHNDIKIGEILMNKEKKIFLCDFGWGSIDNRLGCGIGIWDCNNKQKPGGYRDDEKTLERLHLI